MKDHETLRLHPTSSGGESGPMIGKFSSRDVLLIGASLLVALMLFILGGTLDWGFLISLSVATSAPLLTLGILLALSGKPTGYARHWITWQWIKCRNHRLFETHEQRQKQ